MAREAVGTSELGKKKRARLWLMSEHFAGKAPTAQDVLYGGTDAMNDVNVVDGDGSPGLRR